MANKRVRKTTHNYYLFLLLLFFATIFMGTGYASVFGVLLNIDGDATVLSQDVVHISNGVYKNDNGAVVSGSSINGYYATTLNSTITLGSNSNSTITYTITIVNDTNEDYLFTGTSYNAPDFYSNTNITFDLVGINVYDKLDAHASKTFDITFRYTGSNVTNPVLDSYISFDFEKYYEITYQHIDTTNKNYPTFILESESTKTVTFTGDVPYELLITPTVSYTYNNGVLVLNNIKTDIVIDRYYSITYVTAGTNAANQPVKYLHGEVVTFLTPTNGNNIFDGWYDNSSYTGNSISDTTGISGDLVLYAKWISNSSEIATTYITSLVGNASTTVPNIITVNSPDNTCTNTFAYDNTSENNLRYVGSNPCNYVKFNCDNNGTCEIWRIIGVMNGIDSSPVLKIVKNNTESSTAAWDSASKNTWVNASLNALLNGTYLNSLNSGVISDYVLNAQWNIGGVTATSNTATAYNEEKGTKSSNAYIGLINPSDYGYATSATSDSTRNTCLTSSLSNTSNTCYDNNYLFTSSHQWTINKRINGNNQAIRITDVGRTTNTKTDSPYYYRPVVYLKSDIKIDTTTGDGRLSNPYILRTSS